MQNICLLRSLNFVPKKSQYIPLLPLPLKNTILIGLIFFFF